LEQSSANAAENIVDEIAARPPCLFYQAPEHPQGEHIEEDMLPSAMHEHVGYQLEQAEIGGQYEMKAETVVKVYAYAPHYIHEQEHAHVDAEEPPCYCRNISHYLPLVREVRPRLRGTGRKISKKSSHLALHGAI